jgi:hypothetical protein
MLATGPSGFAGNPLVNARAARGRLQNEDVPDIRTEFS